MTDEGQPGGSSLGRGQVGEGLFFRAEYSIRDARCTVISVWLVPQAMAGCGSGPQGLLGARQVSAACCVFTEGVKDGSEFSQDERVLSSCLGQGPPVFAGRMILMDQQAAVACG